MMILAALTVFHIALIAGLIIIINIIVTLRCYYRCGPDEAIVRTGLGGAQVSFDHGLLAIPVAHRVEIVNISARSFEIDIPVNTRDEKPAILKGVFVLSVNKAKDDVLSALKFSGIERMSDDKLLQRLFEPSFIEAVIQVAKQFTYGEINEKHYQVSEQVIRLIGSDLNGFSFDLFSFSID